jgi:hypothetical protein
MEEEPKPEIMWSAELNQISPRYLIWRDIFERDDRIPINSPLPLRAKLDGEADEVYLLDWQDLEEGVAERLVAFIAKKFNATAEEVVAQLDKDGFFPIRRADLHVSASLKGFI